MKQCKWTKTIYANYVLIVFLENTEAWRLLQQLQLGDLDRDGPAELDLTNTVGDSEYWTWEVETGLRDFGA